MTNKIRKEDVTSEMINFISEKYKTMMRPEVIEKFYNKFGIRLTKYQFKYILRTNGIKSGKGKHKPKKERKSFSPKQIQYLRDNFRDKTTGEMSVELNELFNDNKTAYQILIFMKNNRSEFPHKETKNYKERRRHEAELMEILVPPQDQLFNEVLSANWGTYEKN